jgi:hypothetical protein
MVSDFYLGRFLSMFEDKVLDISLNFPDPHQNLVQSMVASYFNNFWNVLQGPEIKNFFTDVTNYVS